jgi:hypothetical protein
VDSSGQINFTAEEAGAYLHGADQGLFGAAACSVGQESIL